MKIAQLLKRTYIDHAHIGLYIHGYTIQLTFRLDDTIENPFFTLFLHKHKPFGNFLSIYFKDKEEGEKERGKKKYNPEKNFFSPWKKAREYGINKNVSNSRPSLYICRERKAEKSR